MDNGVGDLVIGQAWIGGTQHRADARNREEQLHVMVSVPGQRRHSISWPHADVTQHVRAAAHTLGESGIVIAPHAAIGHTRHDLTRSEEHTSELQSLMRISYAVFCLKKKNTTKKNTTHSQMTN